MKTMSQFLFKIILHYEALAQEPQTRLANIHPLFSIQPHSVPFPLLVLPCCLSHNPLLPISFSLSHTHIHVTHTHFLSYYREYCGWGKMIWSKAARAGRDRCIIISMHALSNFNFKTERYVMAAAVAVAVYNQR